MPSATSGKRGRSSGGKRCDAACDERIRSAFELEWGSDWGREEGGHFIGILAFGQSVRELSMSNSVSLDPLAGRMGGSVHDATHFISRGTRKKGVSHSSISPPAAIGLE